MKYYFTYIFRDLIKVIRKFMNFSMYHGQHILDILRRLKEHMQFCYGEVLFSDYSID